MLRAAIVLTALLFVVSAHSDNIPRQKQSEKVNANQQGINSNKKPTVNNTTASAPIPANDRVIESNKNEDHPTDSWLTEFFSGFNLTDLLVAISTIVIAWYSVRQYTMMEKMMVLANRPNIVVSFAKLHLDGNIIRMPEPNMGVQYFVRNKGGTNAIVTENKVCLTSITGKLPYFLPYEGVKRINDADYTLMPGKPWACDVPWSAPPTLYELFMNAIRGKVTIVLFGYIAYKDETGAADRKYFKRWWNPNTHAFEPYSSKDHNGEEE